MQTEKVTPRKVIRIEQKEPLFSHYKNPNKEIFSVETQEGADQDDQGHGSIGDAVMDHMFKMSHKLPEIGHFIHMPNGNLFRVEEDVRDPEVYHENFIRNQMVKVLASKIDPDAKDAVLGFMQSELEPNESDDALDQNVVPYSEWETRPQQTSIWDIPSTPKPLFIYAGNCRQYFYDEFPEDHPDARLINQFIARVNKIDWDDFDDYTAMNLSSWIESKHQGLAPGKDYWRVATTPIHLTDFCNDLVYDASGQPPEEKMAETLEKIDIDYRKSIYPQYIASLNGNGPGKYIEEAEQMIKEKYAEGHLVWADIANLGKRLFSLYGDVMTKAHWQKYRRLRYRYPPKVMLGSLNINTSGFNDMYSFFRSKEFSEKDATKLAKDIFFKRPFRSTEELLNKVDVSSTLLGSTKKNAAFIAQVKIAKKQSKLAKDTRPLGRLAHNILEKQKAQPNMMSEEEWSSVWQAYRIAKKEVQSENML